VREEIISEKVAVNHLRLQQAGKQERGYVDDLQFDKEPLFSVKYYVISFGLGYYKLLIIPID